MGILSQIIFVLISYLTAILPIFLNKYNGCSQGVKDPVDYFSQVVSPVQVRVVITNQNIEKFQIDLNGGFPAQISKVSFSAISAFFRIRVLQK